MSTLSLFRDNQARLPRADFFLILIIILTVLGCKKDRENRPSVATSLSFKVNGIYNGTLNYNGLNNKPTVQFSFTEPLNTATIAEGVTLADASGGMVPYTTVLSDNDKTLTISPADQLPPLAKYVLSVNAPLNSASGGILINPVNIKLTVGVDSTDKFPLISDELLLDLVQKQTLTYFYDFAHPVSGLARERSTSGETVTTGGSGFGVMAILVGIERGFISREDGFAHIRKIVTFLGTKADRYHGAFPHWLNGTTGDTRPFSARDDGADLVETSLLVQGLIAARQYFDRNAEAGLRADINEIWHAIEWDFFQRGEQRLYWHWSPNYAWEMNLPIAGWNESLITYVLAASSPTHPITKEVYDNGWASRGGMRNGNTYHGIQLPLGRDMGGPLFFAHYSFLGINPFGLSDAYADYEAQVKAHTAINRAHCIANPGAFYGYSKDCWGLTASDDINGYMAHSPTNDNGVITPTAALSSFPYTPQESFEALRFFYYKLGDKIWGEYGFRDAFSLHHSWFADSYLAIDQGPIIVMIENYRTGLLWDLFMSAPEVQAGLAKLGFTSPGE